MATVLITEHDEGVLSALAMLLRRSGYQVLEADRSEAALESVASHGPDILLTDVNMPGMTGVELIKKLRKSHPALGIIAISGGGMHQNPELATTLASIAGADRVLEKPFKNEALLSDVSALLASARRSRAGRR
jgi:CheY-like chemotaxis protein